MKARAATSFGEDATSSAPLLRVRSLTTSYVGERGSLRVVDDVSFSLEGGKVLSVVGESGSGKTALCRSIMRLFPTSKVHVDGQVIFDDQQLLELDDLEMSELWGTRIAMVFQDPMSSLNPVMRVGNQVAEGPRRRLHMARSAAKERAISALKSAGIADAKQRYSRYPHELSGGLRQRVAIAIAIANGPKLILADEPTTGLDVTVQAQILSLVNQLSHSAGIAVIMVTHDLAVAASASDDIAVMYAGRVVEIGPAREVIGHPRMRYTEALLLASPRLYQTPHARLNAIAGRPPDPLDLGPGCAFSPRCPHADSRCFEERPELTASSEDPRHLYACWHPASAALDEFAKLAVK
ncbi:MAG: ABC transporter ATP-binding protein [Acidimicrobiales bacterium]